MSKELKYEYYLIIKLQNKYIFQIIDGKYRNLHFSTFICLEQVLNIVTFSKYFGYTVSISSIIKCRVGEIDTMILKFLHGVKKHPNMCVCVCACVWDLCVSVCLCVCVNSTKKGHQKFWRMKLKKFFGKR